MSPKIKIQSKLDLGIISTHLAAAINDTLKQFSNSKHKPKREDLAPETQLYPLLAAINAAKYIEGNLLTRNLSLTIRDLEKASKRCISKGLLRGWSLRVFLITHFFNELSDPRPNNFNVLYSTPLPPNPKAADPIPRDSYDTIVTSCVGAIVKNLNRESQLVYLGELLQVFDEETTNHGQLVAIHYVIDHIPGKLQR
jgi:hypothetical protein